MAQPPASVTLPPTSLLPHAAVAIRTLPALPHAVACRLAGTAAATSAAAVEDRTGTVGCRPSLPRLPLSLSLLPLPSLPPQPAPSLPSPPLPALPTPLGRAPLPRPAAARSRATSRCRRLSVKRTSSMHDGRRCGSCGGPATRFNSKLADCSNSWQRILCSRQQCIRVRAKVGMAVRCNLWHISQLYWVAASS